MLKAIVLKVEICWNTLRLPKNNPGQMLLLLLSFDNKIALNRLNAMSFGSELTPTVFDMPLGWCISEFPLHTQLPASCCTPHSCCCFQLAIPNTGWSQQFRFLGRILIPLWNYIYNIYTPKYNKVCLKTQCSHKLNDLSWLIICMDAMITYDG